MGVDPARIGADTTSPASVTHLRETFGTWSPDAEIVVVDSAGRYPTVETPPRLASLLQRFLLDPTAVPDDDPDGGTADD